jgi:hypothetical protein
MDRIPLARQALESSDFPSRIQEKETVHNNSSRRYRFRGAYIGSAYCVVHHMALFVLSLQGFLLLQ